jgi:hypothetical protein
MFKNLRKRIDEEGLGYLTDNNLLRYCKSYLWNIDLAFLKLCNGERWRRDNGCMEISRHEILNEINLKFVFIYGHDRCGRSLVWIRCRNYLPDRTNER